MKNEVKGKTVSDTTKKTATAKKATEGVAAAVKSAEKAAAKVADKTEKVVAKVVEKTEEAAAKPAAKAAAKKAPAKKAAVKETVYLQYLGKEIDKDELVKQVKDIWTNELKNKAADLKDVTLYLKPEENAAYYVVNGDVTGKIEL